MKCDYNLKENSYFKWFQVVSSIPKAWKESIVNDKGDCRNLLYLNHHLIKGNSILALEKLIPAELYSLSITVRNTIPTS